MKKNFNIMKLLTIFITIFLFSTVQGKNREYELTLVHVNDLHGRVKEGKYDGVGLARVATIAKGLAQDKTNGKVLLLDAGDTLHGTTFATLGKGMAMVEAMNATGFDYATLGNHDFNYGSQRLKELLSSQKYETLAANVIDKTTNEPLTKEYVIRKIKGRKVGFFGLATPETYFKTNPKNLENIVITEPISAARYVVRKLKEENVDFIVLISHLGDDVKTELKYQSIGIAKAVPEIDLIIDGHSHTKLDKKLIVNGVTIVQTGEYGKNVGVVKVDFDKLPNNMDAITYQLYTKDIILNGDNPVKEDEKVKAVIEDISSKQKKITNVKVGSSEIMLDGDRKNVRTKETNLAQLINDAVLWKTKADVAIANGGGIRSSISAGDITIGNIIEVLPFGNYVIVKKIKGEDLKKAVENGLKAYPESSGAMLQVAGMTVKFNKKNPAYRRVLEITIGDEKLDLNKFYSVAMNDFMAAGGDEYTSLMNGIEIGHYPGLDEILIDYIKEVGIDKNRSNVEQRLISID